MLVIIAARNETFRASAESIFAVSRVATGSQVVPSAAVALPTTAIDGPAMRALLDSQAIDGVLIVRFAGIGSVTTREVRNGPMCYAGTPMQCLGAVPTSAAHWETNVGRLTFRATLYDGQTMHPVWIGRTDVYRNGKPSSPYVPALAREVITSLAHAHLLLPRPATE